MVCVSCTALLIWIVFTIAGALIGAALVPAGRGSEEQD